VVKQLTKHGNSLALVIDFRLLNLLDISVDTPLYLTTDGKCLVVASVRDAKRRELFCRTPGL
jgi:antitoxin component of MazEF toxin-antitoxin module